MADTKGDDGDWEKRRGDKEPEGRRLAMANRETE